jgi:hypothetical protein
MLSTFYIGIVLKALTNEQTNHVKSNYFLEEQIESQK